MANVNGSKNGIDVQEADLINGNYGKYYENIYRALTLGEALHVKPEQAVDVLRIIEAAEKSHLEKRRIAL